jgi:hypothetical protein
MNSTILIVSQFNSALTDLKINLFLPLIPKGNRLIFSFHPLGFGAKKAENL